MLRAGSDHHGEEHHRWDARVTAPLGLSVEFMDTPVCSLNFAFGGQKVGKPAKVPIGVGGRRGEVVSTDTEGCQAPLLIRIAATEAVDAVLNAKDRVWDARALGVQVAPCKIGSHWAVQVDEWRRPRLREKLSSAEPVRSEEGDLSTYIAIVGSPSSTSCGAFWRMCRCASASA